MGVNISKLITSKEIRMDNLTNKKIAIDSFNWIYQFLSIIRQIDGEPLKDSKGRITSHLSGLFYRTSKLIESGIQPVYVFDGKPPEMKKKETDRRKDVREEAKQEWKKALAEKDYTKARKHAQRSTQITGEIIESSKKLLNAMGVPVVQAKSEGEAQCSHMCKIGQVWASASQDFDSVIYATPRLIRNLSISGRKKRGSSYITVNPEQIEISKVLEELEIDHDKLIMLAILIGTDYNTSGVKGIGPAKALKLVREKNSLEDIMKGLEWEGEHSPQEIFNIFKSPDVFDPEIEFKDIDEEKIKKILCDEHEFSIDRIKPALKKLSEKPAQKSLSSWLGG